MKKPAIVWTDYNVAVTAAIRTAVAARSPRYLRPVRGGWIVDTRASLFGDCLFISASGRTETLSAPYIDESGEVAGNLDTLPLFAA